MARVLSLIAGLASVALTGGCSLLMLDDMDFSANAESSQTMPTADGPGEKDTKTEGTLPAPSVPSNEPTDAGADSAPSGPKCTTASRTPSQAANLDTGNGERPAWDKPFAAGFADNTSASVALSTKPSQRLRLTGFGFQVPVSATIRGVSVFIKRSASNYFVGDENVSLEIAPDVRRPAPVRPWNSPTTIVLYGGATDTWGAAITPAMVNAAAFGFNIVATVSNNNSATASIDEVKITVHYCIN